MKRTIVIGAGITGLSFAYYYRRPHLLLEKEDRPGGLCSSLCIDSCTFDYSGHFLHIRDSENLKFAQRLLKENITKIERNAWIYTHGVYVPYPFQANLYALPGKIRNECVNGFLSRHLSGALRADSDFYRWSLATFGQGITDHFMKPYNEKLWTVSSRTLSSAWVAPFVPMPSPEEITEGASRPPSKRYGYNAHFYYPRKGGIQALINGFSRGIKDLSLNAEVISIDYRKRFALTIGGNKFSYDYLVSTQPLPELLKQMGPVPDDIRAAAEKLRWNSVACLNLAVKPSSGGNRAAEGKHWVYFPEKDFNFYRAGIYTNVAPSAAPPGYRSMYVEMSHRPHRTPDPARAYEKAIEGLKKCRLIGATDVVTTVNWLPVPYAYVIYDRNRSEAVGRIQRFLSKHSIYSIGRYGAWDYSFMEKSINEGRNLARFLSEKK